MFLPLVELLSKLLCTCTYFIQFKTVQLDFWTRCIPKRQKIKWFFEIFSSLSRISIRKNSKETIFLAFEVTSFGGFSKFCNFFSKFSPLCFQCSLFRHNLQTIYVPKHQYWSDLLVLQKQTHRCQILGYGNFFLASERKVEEILSLSLIEC